MILQVASSINSTWRSGLKPTALRCQVKYVSWSFPPDGWYKLNTDGASKGNQGEAGRGGLIKDDSVSWISGFVLKIGYCSTYNAEVWSILRGIQLALDLGIHRLLVESDSASAIASISTCRDEAIVISC